MGFIPKGTLQSRWNVIDADNYKKIIAEPTAEDGQYSLTVKSFGLEDWSWANKGVAYRDEKTATRTFSADEALDIINKFLETYGNPRPPSDPYTLVSSIAPIVEKNVVLGTVGAILNAVPPSEAPRRVNLSQIIREEGGMLSGFQYPCPHDTETEFSKMSPDEILQSIDFA